MSDIDLKRFQHGYRLNFDQALNERNGGRERSH